MTTTYYGAPEPRDRTRTREARQHSIAMRAMRRLKGVTA